MRKPLTLLLALLMLISTAFACTPTTPADPEEIASLLPGYTLVDSIDDGDELRLLVRTPADELVFVGGILNDDGEWEFTQSTPLPEGTTLGVENFTHSLGIPGETYYYSVSLAPYADGTWGVSCFYPDQDGLFNLGQHSISEDAINSFALFGDHPWSDITAMDWTSLPASYEEAITHLDASRWAMVNNPDPEDRLHLRVSPDKEAASLGKYYNRTPVEIRQYGKEWCAVTVCGLDGWMMTKYLAFGEDMYDVQSIGPWLTWKENLTEHRLYEEPSSASAYTTDDVNSFYIRGVAGDYYHVWLPYSESYGYIHMDDLWEGNG